MWLPAVMKALARLARPGATLATYTTARAVRDALAGAGFVPELRPGFGRKRQMLAARYAPPRPPRHAAPTAPAWSERHAIVVGAGLAGAAVTERLVARGWRVDVIERRPAPAAEASGIPAGVFHPHVSRDDSILSRLTRAGFLYALGRWQALESAGHRLDWRRCGVLQVAKDSREEPRMAATARALGFPADYLDFLPRGAAGARVGRELRSGGWWFAGSGWMQPAGLIAAQLATAEADGRLTLHVNAGVQALERVEHGWRALAPDGAAIASAPVVVLANAHDVARLIPLATALRSVRGQLSCLPAGHLALPRAVLTGAGHLVPLGDGSAVAGATYDFEDEDPAPSEEGHAGNLERLERLLPGRRRDRSRDSPARWAFAASRPTGCRSSARCRIARRPARRASASATARPLRRARLRLARADVGRARRRIDRERAGRGARAARRWSRRCDRSRAIRTAAGAPRRVLI